MLRSVKRSAAFVTKILRSSNINLAPIAYTFFREQGVKATVRKIVDVLGMVDGEAQVRSADRWYHGRRNQFESPTEAGNLFVGGRLTIIGAMALPQCRKYRVMQKIEQLRDVWSVDVEVADDFDIHRAFNLMQTSTAVIFYRVPNGIHFDACIKEAHRLGVSVGYDIDDPIFSLPIYRTNPNLNTLAPREKNELLGDSPNYLAAIEKCDYFITSTPGMVKALEDVTSKPIFLWRNALDAESQTVANEILAEDKGGLSRKEVRIGYMSGSRAHDEDFSLISYVLAQLMKNNPEVKLVIGGYARVPESLAPFRGRIVIYPYCGYRGYFQNISNVDIVVVPLVKDIFNECKSAIRYLEAAIMKKPCVASDVGDFSHIVDDGRTGFLASSTEDWFEALNQLIASQELRHKTGSVAAAEVNSNYIARVISQRLPDQLINFIKGRSNG